eukprot:422052_1
MTSSVTDEFHPDLKKLLMDTIQIRENKGLSTDFETLANWSFEKAIQLFKSDPVKYKTLGKFRGTVAWVKKCLGIDQPPTKEELEEKAREKAKLEKQREMDDLRKLKEEMEGSLIVCNTDMMNIINYWFNTLNLYDNKMYNLGNISTKIMNELIRKYYANNIYKLNGKILFDYSITCTNQK